MTDQLSKVFAALADPTRRDMVSRLCAGDATVGELAAPYDVSMQAVSKHLKVLEGAGLVTRGKDAQRRPVHLEAEVFDLMTKWIERYRQQAEERYQRLDAVLAAMNEPRRPTPTQEGSIMSTTDHHDGTATIEAVEGHARDQDHPRLPATPAQLVKAHTDPELFVQWVGPERDRHPTIDYWDARTGGSWRYVDHTRRRGVRASTAASTTVRDDRLVQTFTFEGFPDSVALETMTFEDLGDGRTRLHVQSLFDSYEAPRRDARRAAWTSASTTATPSSTGCSADGDRSDPPGRHTNGGLKATTSYDVVVSPGAWVDRMDQRISFVTLAVADLDRTRAFYVDGLGWKPGALRARVRC